MESELIAIVTQFGAAGLIGWLWIAERRHNAKRERELSEAHQRVVGQDRDLASLLNVVKENTRAIKGLEETQRQLLQTVLQLAHGSQVSVGRSLLRPNLRNGRAR